MYEFENFEYEFSKIYKRLLRLELLIKYKIINSVLLVHKNNTMTIFKKFFSNEYIYNFYKNDSKKKNYFLEIRDNKSIIDAIKFEKIINMLTLRHLLHFMFTEEAFRNPEISTKFYAKESINFKQLKENRMLLINLRNYVAHFNFKEYETSKNEYLQALILYEICLGCSLGKYENIPNQLGYKPNMTDIITKIFELCPELFKKDIPHSNFPYNKDRIIVDMYEDIAVLNGWEYRELKSQWDVIRQKFRFNQQKTENGEIDLEVDNGQITLFDDESIWG